MPGGDDVGVEPDERLVVTSVAGPRPKGNDKAAVVTALFATTRNSILGSYEFDRDGDTTLGDYGVYTVANGLPTYSSAIK